MTREEKNRGDKKTCIERGLKMNVSWARGSKDL